MDNYWQNTHNKLSLRAPIFIGILNITPDSFSDGGLYKQINSAVSQAHILVANGANIIDLGAESTRPGSTPVAPEVEWDRLEPVLRRVREELPNIPISLDTKHSSVAAKGLKAGVSIINDVSGFKDESMLKVIKNSNCGIIAMRSDIKNEQFIMPPYEQKNTLHPKIAIYELEIIKNRLLYNNIAVDRIILDPGFGFGTSFAGDYSIWKTLDAIPKILKWPPERFCIGLSRKRFLAWKASIISMPPVYRDNLTRKAHSIAIKHGYRVFRAHKKL